MLTMDFSNWLFCPDDSSVYKELTLVLKVPPDEDFLQSNAIEDLVVGGKSFINLTHVGALDYLVASNQW